MECKSCGKKIGKFDRRIQADDVKPELWGDDSGRVGRLHTLDAGVFCGWECVTAYADRRSAPVAVARAV
jgi:hypothetical protein